MCKTLICWEEATGVEEEYKIFFFFSDWLEATGRNVNFEMHEPEELSLILRQFYAEVRQKNGNNYSRSGLTNIRASIQRHIASPPFNRNINIIRDREFGAANSVIQGQIKLLRRSGNDVTKHKQAIDNEDMKKILASFDVSTPSGLQNKVFFDLLLHFARCGQEGLRELTRKSVIIKTDSSGRRYATMAYNEIEKNHTGQNLKERDIQKIMYELPKDKNCPVASLEKYISKLNDKFNAFFQRPKVNYTQDGIWYDNMAVGKNTLGNKMKLISAHAKCATIYTNHCVRATAATVLARAGIERKDICAVTGHKREETLKNYIAEPTKSERRNMSNILHKYGSKSAAVSLKPKQSTSTQQSPVPGPSSYDSESPVPSTSKGHLPVALCPDDDSDVDEPAAKVPRCDDVVSKKNIQNDLTISSTQEFHSLFSGNNFYGTVNFYIKNWMHMACEQTIFYYNFIFYDVCIYISM